MKSLREETTDQSDDLAAINNLIRSLMQSNDVDTIVDEILRFFLEHFGFDMAFVALVDGDAAEVTHYRCHNPTVDTAALKKATGLRLSLEPTEGGFHAAVMRKGRSIYVPRVRISSRMAEVDQLIVSLLHFNSALYVPFTTNQGAIGVLDLVSLAPRDRDTVPVEKIEALATQVSGALQRAQLHAELEKRQAEAEMARQETEILSEMARRANQASDLTEILRTVTEVTRDRYGAERLAFFTLDSQRAELQLRSAIYDGQVVDLDTLPEPSRSIPMRPESGTLYRTVKRGKSFHIPRVDRKWLESSPVDKLLLDLGQSNWVVQLPLIVEETVIGLLVVIGPSERRLSRDEIRFGERMAAQVAGAVRATDLQTQTEAALEQARRAREEIEELASLAREANQISDLTELINDIFETIMSRFPVKQIALQIVDAESRIMRCLAARSPLPENRKFTEQLVVPLNPSGGVLFRTYQRKKPFYFALREGDHFPTVMDRQIVDTLGIRYFGHWPLIVENETIGIVWADFSEPASREVRQSLTKVCDQIAGAVRNANLMAEAQRQRIQAESARDESRLLAELSRKAAESADLETVLGALIDIVNDRFGLDRGMLYMVSEGRDHLVARSMIRDGRVFGSATVPQQLERIPVDPEIGGVSARTFHKRRPLRGDATGSRREKMTAIDRAVTDFFDMERFCILPLVLEGVVHGVIGLAGAPGVFLRRTHVPFVERLVDQLVGAIRTSELLLQTEQARNDAENAHREAELLAMLARQANEAKRPEHLLELIVDIFQERFELDRGALYRRDDESNCLHMVAAIRSGKTASVSEAPEVIQRIPIKRESGTLVRTLEKGRPLRGDAGGRRSEMLTTVDRNVVDFFQFERYVQFPLMVEGKAIGVLCSAGKPGVSLARSAMPFCERAVAQLAGAFRAADLLASTEAARAESDRLLTNILPPKIAQELKEEGSVEPLFYESVSVLFTDFVGFTKISETMMPDELVEQLDGCFGYFDSVIERHGLEKLKTMGDAYMCCAGLPEINQTHPVDACLAALEFREFMQMMGNIKDGMGMPYWELRLGIHTGPVTAGVIGTAKFAYDIWGDTVNVASRMESSGEPGKVNISSATYEAVKDFFDCSHRGKIDAKGKGEMDMYFVDRIKPELSADEEGLAPNDKFIRLRESIGDFDYA